MSKEPEYIEIVGARVHNLRNLTVKIPRNKLVVITGLSGSGKSSLAFDTLYADGQRRYVESLSSYARQFMGRMNKPEVDAIHGISPAIAIEQKVNTRNPRSTVGTSTEIYDYLKLLYARVGRTISPVSGREVKRHSVADVVDFAAALPEATRLMVLTPLHANGRPMKVQLEVLMQQGYSRVYSGGELYDIEELVDGRELPKGEEPALLVDRLATRGKAEDWKERLADSVETAFYEGQGRCCLVYFLEDGEHKENFSNRFELDGMRFEEPRVDFFSFNNPYGACKRCEGYGSVIGIDPDLVIPDKSKSVYEGAVAAWRGDKLSQWKDRLILNARYFDFPIHKPYCELSQEQQGLLWTGNEYFEGIDAFFKEVENNSYKIQYRVLLSRYRGKTLCPECRGTRLRKDTGYVKVGGCSISDILLMTVEEALAFFQRIQLSPSDEKVARRILTEIINRLQVLVDVGLPYLSLNRQSNTLSGGESQRINLATSLGSSLVGSTYILDEPSIGLHPRDNRRLIKVLKSLRDLGNTVIVVEHDEDVMKEADYIIDIGPGAGRHGGQVVYAGSYAGLLKESDGLTARYLRREMKIETPALRRRWDYSITLRGAQINNLKNVDAVVPLGVITVVTGVSGSGKTSLIKDTLYPALRWQLGEYVEQAGRLSSFEGDYLLLGEVVLVDQNPIGRSSRSNPVTYVKAFDDIRALYASQKLAKLRSYKPGFFSFNVAGGRCEMCQGEGVMKVEMQFMADIYLSCEHCGGLRYKPETLDIKYRGKHIAEVLDMTVSEALEFFAATKTAGRYEKAIYQKIKVLDDVGLGYIKLGQPSNTLSGGEAQRIKLAYYLSLGRREKKTLFIFDEPTTGLHYHDIQKLYLSINRLIALGHTVVIIEHNRELIKCADWIIDMGPEGGSKGGELVFAGTPEELVKQKNNHTAQYLSLD